MQTFILCRIWKLHSLLYEMNLQKAINCLSIVVSISLSFARPCMIKSFCMYHMHIYIIYYIYIWDSLRENCPSHIYMNCYKNASLLNRYIFRTVNAINVLISIFILHYFPIVKYILESCTCSVPVLQRSIPQRVQTRHNFL